jgi:predicted ATPase/class 3 adenylate cyclase
MLADIGDDLRVRPELPTGTVTFLFTDVVGSTSLLNELGAEGYAEALVGHCAAIRDACGERGGVEVDTQGDAFFFVFPTAPGAIAAATDFTERLVAKGPIRVRVGIHTGTPYVGAEGYVGHDVHRAARIAAAGHGGQVLVSGSTASLIDNELTDLGEHRFKDLGAPERVYQLGSDDHPALKTLYRTNLPVPATPFLGRERELREAVERITRDDTRLVTLTGPGGTGKTRLLLQAAAEASDSFPDGIHWIPLAPVRDESSIGTAFAQVLDVQERSGVAVADSLSAALGDKRALVVVDNCEHVLEAVAGLMQTLLDGCPRLVVATSSRERLGLRAERIYDVPPMTPSDGVALFVERASAVSPGVDADEHVRAICETVDELPLAIELAAARARSLSTRTIRERLADSLGLLATRNRDVEERQRTLAATIAWSYDLLDEDEQRVLRQLSVFAGGCTLDAARVVADADLDSLESLVDKSLVRHRVDAAGQDRYWMLETVREYAASQLFAARESEQTGARHMEFFLEAAASLLAPSGLPTFDEQLERFKADRPNYAVAHARAIARGDGASAIRFARRLNRCFWRLGPFMEGYSVTLASLELYGGTDEDRGYALVGAANFAVLLGGELKSARRLLAQAEALFERIDDKVGLAEVLAVRSKIGEMVGNYPEAVRSAERMAELARELGNPNIARWADLKLADALSARALEEGDVAAAEQSRAMYEKVRGHFATLHAAFEETALNDALALVEFAAGNYSESIAYSQRALLIARNRGIEHNPDQLLVLGWAAGSVGVPSVGVKLVSVAMRQFREDGFDIELWGRVQMKRFERSCREALGDEGYQAAVSEAEAMSDEEAVQLALTVNADG